MSWVSIEAPHLGMPDPQAWHHPSPTLEEPGELGLSSTNSPLEKVFLLQLLFNYKSQFLELCEVPWGCLLNASGGVRQGTRGIADTMSTQG